MKRWYVALIVILASLLPAFPALAQVRERPLLVPADQHIAGNIATTTQDIEIAGTVDGDVTSWSGDIAISGHVGGDVVSYNGHIALAGMAQVDGHILALSGGVQREPSASVTGQVLGGPEPVGALASLFDIFAPAPVAQGSDAAVGRLLFSLAFGVFLLAFCLLCIALWPGRTATASLTLRRLPLRALALGLLTTLILGLLLLPLVTLLTATLIGLPLIVVLLALALVPYIYGLSTLALLPARALPRTSGVSQPALVLAATLALLVALVALVSPLAGLALFYLVASPGLGAAILSRGGLMVPVGARSAL
jgi:hypothetical protein